jgi:tetratricopeptide (TPR) repeat protein
MIGMDESLQIIELADTERIMRANVKEAIKLLEHLGEEIKDDVILSYDYPAVLKRLGICYFETGQTGKARESLENALEIAKKDFNNIEIADIRATLAFLEVEAGTLDKALYYAQKSWNYIDGKKGEKFTPTKANTAEVLGRIYYEKGEYDDALDMFNSAVEQAKKVDFVERILTAKLNSVKYYITIGKMGRAEEYFGRYVAIAKEGYGLIYPQYQMVQAQISIAKGNIGDAISLMRKAYRVFKKNNLLRLKAECAKQLGDLYAQRKDSVKADAFSREALEIYNEAGLNFPVQHPIVRDWFTTFDDLGE